MRRYYSTRITDFSYSCYVELYVVAIDGAQACTGTGSAGLFGFSTRPAVRRVDLQRMSLDQHYNYAHAYVSPRSPSRLSMHI